MRSLKDIFVPDSAPYIVAEVGLNHDGSLGLAHAFVDAVARTGADAVKFQTHIAEAESSPREQFRVAFSHADANRYDYWKRTSFTRAQWAELKSHAEERGLTFLSSPFSLEAVELLESIGVEGWKVPSGEIASRRMLQRMGATGKPVLLSTGMSSLKEIDTLVDFMEKLCSGRLAVLQCTTAYPTNPEAVGLNVLMDFLRRYDCPIGLSDHSGTPWPSVVAAYLGARIIEVHVTLSRDMFGPDISSSLDRDGLAALVQGVQFGFLMRCNDVDKDVVAREMAPLRRLFGKSAAARRDVQAGEMVTDSDVVFLKPGQGLSEQEFEACLGRRLKRPVPAGSEFRLEDFES